MTYHLSFFEINSDKEGGGNSFRVGEKNENSLNGYDMSSSQRMISDMSIKIGAKKNKRGSGQGSDFGSRKGIIEDDWTAIAVAGEDTDINVSKIKNSSSGSGSGEKNKNSTDINKSYSSDHNKNNEDDNNNNRKKKRESDTTFVTLIPTIGENKEGTYSWSDVCTVLNINTIESYPRNLKGELTQDLLQSNLLSAVDSVISQIENTPLYLDIIQKSLLYSIKSDLKMHRNNFFQAQYRDVKSPYLASLITKIKDMLSFCLHKVLIAPLRDSSQWLAYLEELRKNRLKRDPRFYGSGKGSGIGSAGGGGGENVLL